MPLPFRLLLLAPLVGVAPAADLDWPEDGIEPRPVLRREWPDEAPAAERIAAEFARFAKLGFGTVEIAPAAAVDPELWPGPSWAEAIDQASEAAATAGLRLDLRCHAGPAPAAGAFPALALEPVERGHRGGPLDWDLSDAPPFCLAAWPSHGDPVDLLPLIDPESGRLHWDAPPGPWRIFGLRSRVAGPTLDPFSPDATAAWLDELSQRTLTERPREVHAYTRAVSEPRGANWTAGLLAAFERQHGYRLPDELPALFGDDDAGSSDRVLCDFRQTLAELQLDSLTAWHELCRQTGSLSRATLGPAAAHPIDLAASIDLPGMPAGPFTPYAASAAHLSTRPLVHAEVGGLDRIRPNDLRDAIQNAWLAGANQLSFRLPADAPAPPAALAGLATWVTRVQSALQHGAPDPDLLLYYPAHDFWSERGGIPDSEPERSAWLAGTGFQRCVGEFQRAGIGFDIVSDRLLERASVVDDRILLGGLSYRCLILPDVRRLPETTALLLLELARRGGRIGVLGSWPDDVPGLLQPDLRRGTMFQALMAVPAHHSHSADQPLALAEAFGIAPEPMTDHGLRCLRRSHADGHHYLVVNPGTEVVDAWFELARPAAAVAVLDPSLAQLRGCLPSHESDDGTRQFRLRIGPGETRILRSFREPPGEVPAYPIVDGEARPIQGPWTLTPATDSDEELPAVLSPIPGSWRGVDGLEPGPVRYRSTFTHPGDGRWLLDLGEVAGSARIRLNDRPAVDSVLPPHHLEVTRLLRSGENALEIEVHQSAEASLAGLLGPPRLIRLATP